ncbi:MAG: FG-GAP-like repeat-containing protein [Candidatus Binatia bacterium]
MHRLIPRGSARMLFERTTGLAAACLAVGAGSIILAAGCSKGGEDAGSASGAPKPVQQALEGPARPALLLAQAWFWTDDEGKPKPGPARLDIWRDGPNGWQYTRLEDDSSNVFHKAIQIDDGILTIGAQDAQLKKWTFEDGTWKADTLWKRSWGGRFDRLRDIEIGDVDHDGVNELVLATHDAGVVAVAELTAGGGEVTVIEMDEKADTFIHEIEIGDLEGDGKLEFFATPSDRNRANASQAGGVVMYRWNGTRYVRTWIEKQEGTHSKEILAHDMDGDGKSELFAVLEAEVDPNDKTKLIRPVEIRQYTLRPDGSFSHRTIATIDDRLTRFLVPGDFDGDGNDELVAASFKRGLFHITPPTGGVNTDARWTSKLIDPNSSGFEHAIYATDLDGDGTIELYVASDDQRELRRYDFSGGAFKKTVLGKLDRDVLTWNITTGRL